MENNRKKNRAERWVALYSQKREVEQCIRPHRTPADAGVILCGLFEEKGCEDAPKAVQSFKTQKFEKSAESLIFWQTGLSKL